MNSIPIDKLRPTTNVKVRIRPTYRYQLEKTLSFGQLFIAANKKYAHILELIS